jgi:primosomal protein N' (replication factor Y) (superfamily II helicase)
MHEIVDIAVPVGVRKTFSYSVPPELRESIRAGMRVLVPFGRKLLTGYVVGFPDSAQVGHVKLRAVRELLEPEPAIPAALVETALWVARYYFAPPGEVFRALFPAGTQVSGERRIALTPKAAALLHGGLRPAGLRPQEDAILGILAQESSLTVKQLAGRCKHGGVETWIESLVAAQLVQVETLVQQPKVKTKEQLGIRWLGDSAEPAAGLPAAQKRLYAALTPDGAPILLQEALRISNSTISAARSLQQKGFVEIAPSQLQRTPVELAPAQNAASLVLTPSQKELVDSILGLILKQKSARCLIHGVTGSGKTEIYLRLIAEVLQRGCTALFLVPEIGLTPLLSRLVVSRFPGQVSLLHSGMSPGERFDQWNRIRKGGSAVVVGTRSAVFAPLQNLRFIVIDEEQDSSYKQDESPCYNAREVAWQRMQQSEGVLLLGSATPSIETFHWSIRSGSCFHMPERVEAKPMPRVNIVDMTREFQRLGKRTVISSALQEELQICMDRGDQAIVLLNRRGYARTMLCRGCGHVFACPDCSVSMTYHQLEDRLTCHYCGRERTAPDVCSECGGPYIHYSGVGTEQLEAMLRMMLPKARIARLDRDSTRRRGVLRSTLFSFAEHKLDLLVGTQMLAKGHDFPNVTLVGVVAADSGLSFPDFRSAERTFQLLTQVAGRAGRGTSPGRVVIQSYYPDNYALQYAQRQDYQGFYNREIEFRKLMGYPPFRGLIQILVADPDHAKASGTAERIAGALKLHAAKIEGQFRPHVLGPAAAPLEKLRGSYRMQVLVKLPPGSGGISILQDCFEDFDRRKVSAAKIHVDVDPLSLL